MSNRPVRRRRSGFRPGIEALESRYVLDASIGLTLPLLGPALVDTSNNAAAQALSASLSSAALAALAHSPDAPTSVLTEPVVEIDVIHVEVRDPFQGVVRQQTYFIETITYETFVMAGRSGGSTDSAPIFVEGPSPRGTVSQPHSSPETPPVVPSTEAPAVAHTSASENATLPPVVGRGNDSGAVIAANAAATARSDSVAAAVVPADRRSDRAAPAAFATSLEIESARAAERRADPDRAPRVPLGTTPSTVPAPASDADAAAAAFRGLATTPASDKDLPDMVVDGFAPSLVEHALRALHSAETKFDSADGSGWYRVALGCWAVAAALAYEAARRKPTLALQSLRYPGVSLFDPEGER
jgi:hypothetical protein